MTKSEMQIERDFFGFVKASALGSSIRGNVYRSEMRPYDAKGEDLIVKFLTGLDNQIQTGIVVINIYVPDIPYGDKGRMVADKVRIGELQELLLAFVEDNDNSEYWLSTESTPATFYNEEIKQHLISTKVKFQRLAKL